MANERKWEKSDGPEKPQGNGGLGSGEEPTGDEAAGRGRQFVAVCATCGTQSYVGADWTWFTCWKCGATSTSMVA